MMMRRPVDPNLSAASGPEENGKNVARADQASNQPRFSYAEVLQKSLVFCLGYLGSGPIVIVPIESP